MIGSRFLTVAATSLTLACVSLGPQPEASRFYQLRSLSEPVAIVAGASIEVGPIRLPGYLDRTRIVERRSPEEVMPLSGHFWAAPLDDQIAAVLAEEIRAVSGLRDVERFPLPSARRPDQRIHVEIMRFEADAAGAVALLARWSIRRTTSPHEIASGEMSTREAAVGPGVPARIEAMSRALTTLAREIAAGIR
jgi:uncharacterized lipoprotein YmbA